MIWIHPFPIYSEIFPVFSYDKTSQHSKWMDNLNVDWSSGWILSCFFWCSGLHTQFSCWRPLVQVLGGGTYRFGVGSRFHIWLCILILNKGEITHLMVDMDLEWGWSFTFDFDKLILISNLHTTDVSFMPRVPVWISLHAWLIHGFGLCIFSSHPKNQYEIHPLLQSMLRLSIHFECLEVLS